MKRLYINNTKLKEKSNGSAGYVRESMQEMLY